MTVSGSTSTVLTIPKSTILTGTSVLLLVSFLSSLQTTVALLDKVPLTKVTTVTRTDTLPPFAAIVSKCHLTTPSDSTPSGSELT